LVSLDVHPSEYSSPSVILLEGCDVYEQRASYERGAHLLRSVPRPLDRPQVPPRAAFVLEARPEVGDRRVSDRLIRLWVPDEERDAAALPLGAIALALDAAAQAASIGLDRVHLVALGVLHREEWHEDARVAVIPARKARRSGEHEPGGDEKG
jgi:hypothetical protein